MDITYEMKKSRKKLSVEIWTTIIQAYGINGQGIKAIHTFKQMLGDGIAADGVTLLTLLNACSHSNMPQECEAIYKSMQKKYGVTPNIKHQTCVVDCFSRTGNLAKAEEFANNQNVTNI